MKQDESTKKCFVDRFFAEGLKCDKEPAEKNEKKHIKYGYNSKKFYYLTIFMFSKQGAWHASIAVYTQADVADIIEYARLREVGDNNA